MPYTSFVPCHIWPSHHQPSKNPFTIALKSNLPLHHSLTNGFWEQLLTNRCASQVASSLHRTNVYVPAGVAALLKTYPALIAPAVHAFCQRDASQLQVTILGGAIATAFDVNRCWIQVIRAMRYFPPETRVWTSVTFTKCLYAMLVHRSFQPDKRTGWTLPPVNDAKRLTAELGMKLVLSFYSGVWMELWNFNVVSFRLSDLSCWPMKKPPTATHLIAWKRILAGIDSWQVWKPKAFFKWVIWKLVALDKFFYFYLFVCWRISWKDPKTLTSSWRKLGNSLSTAGTLTRAMSRPNSLSCCVSWNLWASTPNNSRRKSHLYLLLMVRFMPIPCNLLSANNECENL